MKILVAEPLAKSGLEILRAHHEVDEKIGLTPEQLCEVIGEYDALLVRSQVKVTAEIIGAATRLVVIGRAGVGVDNVDLEAATRAGIVVVNAPTGNTISAAEQTLALMLALARKTAAADASVRRAEWKRSSFTGVELRGRTLGVVGLGKIGQAVADRARAFEMTVIGYDPFVTADVAALHGINLVDLDAIVERSDIITAHVPLNKATRGMFAAPEIARMKPGVMLVNVARGGVFDEAAVAAALADGKVAGAAFDVYEKEPPDFAGPLFGAPNTVLTPHLGALTAEAQLRVAEEACEQVIDVLDGRSARYAVNAPLLTPETAHAIAPYLPLTETLGRFLGQFVRGAVKTLTLEVAGDLARYDTSQLGAAALRGLLENAGERVNLINAAFLAKNRGITVVERKTSEAGTFASLVTLVAETDNGLATVAGTIANGETRIVRIDDYWLDMAPAPWMLITRHQDAPGTMGRIGLMLGEADVNISAMHLGRSAPRKDALMLLALDNEVPDPVADAIRKHPAVFDLWVIATER